MNLPKISFNLVKIKSFLTHKLLLILGLIVVYLSLISWQVVNFAPSFDFTEIQSADVIIVLGAGIEGNEPSPVFANRLDTALFLWQNQKAKYIIVTGGFGPKATVSDSQIGKNYLVNQVQARFPEISIDSAISDFNNQIKIEEKSKTTFQNLVEAIKIMQSNNWSRVIIVSDSFHLWRASWMTYSATDAANKNLSADQSLVQDRNLKNGNLNSKTKANFQFQFVPSINSPYKSFGTQIPFLAREVYFIHYFWLFRQ